MEVACVLLFRDKKKIEKTKFLTKIVNSKAVNPD